MVAAQITVDSLLCICTATWVKKGIYLDLKPPEGQEVAKRLVKDADVFVENMKLGTADRLALGYEAVSKVNPRIVYGNHPGWGDAGPLKGVASSDIVGQAFSGTAGITGKRGGEAELLRWYVLHDFNASSYIVATALLGLLQRERTGKGIKMESPQVGASIAIQTSRIAEFLATGENVPRMGSATTTTVPDRAFLCQDKRWLAVSVPTNAQWKGLCKAVGAPELLEDDRFATNPGRVKHRDEVEDRLQAVFTTKPARWWTIQLRKQKVPVSLFYDYETIPDLPQVKANRYIVPVKYPRVGTLPFGNLPFQFSKTPVAQRPGPWPGQDTERVLREGWGEDGANPAKGYFGPKGPMEKGVLDGVSVVDMTQGLAGPYASLLLADAGARVIKVEPPEGDYARDFGPPMMDGVSAVFYHLNRNKEGTRLDLRKQEERQRLLELVKDADVFIEEEGQGRLKRLGLSHENLAKINPGLIHCTITPFGTKGPLRNQPASELVLQAMSDQLATLGEYGSGEEPVRMGPDMASLGTSLFVFHGILGGLYHKWRTGEGQHVTVSMLGTMMFQRGINWPYLVEPDRWDVGFVLGYVTPPDYGYKVSDGQIIMGAPRNPERFPDLLRALGIEGHLEEPLFQHPPSHLIGFGFGGNVPVGDVPYKAKPVWEDVFKGWRTEGLVALLMEHGSNAWPVNDYQRLFSHPQTEAMGMVKEATDSKLGKVKFLGPPWRLHGVQTVSPRPYAKS